MRNKSNQSSHNFQGENQISLAPTKHSSIFNVELHLPHKTVYPGKLDLSGEGCFRAKQKREHIHRKLNGWGVNAEVIERYEFKWISILCDGIEYLTSKDFLTHFGKRLTYRNFETQYILPIELWGVDAVREFEIREAMKPQQLSMFQAA